MKPKTKPKTAQQPKKKKPPVEWGWVFLWLCFFLVLYVLSVGPVMMLAGRKPLPHYAAHYVVRKYYPPLGWVYDSKWFHKPLGQYLHFWAPALYDKNGDMSVGL